MKQLILISAITAAGLASATPVVSPSGVRAEFKSGASPLFESVGRDAESLPLDWPAAATKAKVTLVRNGRTNEVELTDTSAATLTIAAPTSVADEACVEVSVAYCDADEIARKTDRAVVYAVTGMNGAAGRFNSAATGSADWGRYTAKQPVIPTLAADDAVTRNGESVGETGSYYRSFQKAAQGVVVTAGLTAADAGYTYSVDIVRTGSGFILFLR